MNDPALLGTYDQWRRLIMRANVYFSIIIFSAEVCLYFVLRWSNLILQPLPEYLFRFLFLPTASNLLILSAGFALFRCLPKDAPILNYLPIFQLAALCFVCATVHCVFSVLFSTFCFPIFMTALFASKRMTRRITLVCLLFLGLSLLLRFFGLRSPSLEPYLIPEGIIAAIMLLSTNLICEILIRYQNEKDRVILEGYEHQLRMQEMLNKDQKTGLYGGTALNAALGQAVDRVQGSGAPLILAVLDIDNFKRVNDTYGHAQGDKVILALSSLMQRLGGQSLMLARFGGEEFAMLFEGVPMQEVLALLETLRQAFAQQSYDFTAEAVTVSIGGALWVPGQSAQKLFDCADAAMYHAKALGKNQTALWES